MFNNHKQSGRTRVNWKNDSKKTKKTHVQQKQVNVTAMDKLYGLQEQFLKDGMNTLEYKNYVQEKVNNNKYYYRKLSEEDVSNLQQRYRRLVQEKDNKVNERVEQNKRNKRQKDLFRSRKKKHVDKQKSETIQQLFKVMAGSKAQGINRRAVELSNDTERWKETKKLLFTGGRYLEKADKDWREVYQKIVSPVTAHLFDKHSHVTLNEYIMNLD